MSFQNILPLGKVIFYCCFIHFRILKINTSLWKQVNPSLHLRGKMCLTVGNTAATALPVPGWGRSRRRPVLSHPCRSLGRFSMYPVSYPQILGTPREDLPMSQRKRLWVRQLGKLPTVTVSQLSWDFKTQDCMAKGPVSKHCSNPIHSCAWMGEARGSSRCRLPAITGGPLKNAI